MNDVILPLAQAATGRGPALLFWLFAALTVVGAVATITRRNAVTAVMCLVGTIVSLAVLYVLLFAHFLAVLQVLVYAGAIMVLFVFVVMILNKDEEEPWARRGILVKGGAGVGLGYLVFRLINVVWAAGAPVNESPASLAEVAAMGTTKAVGRVLFGPYLFPFEAVSLVLLIAVVGALVLAHPKRDDVPE